MSIFHPRCRCCFPVSRRKAKQTSEEKAGSSDTSMAKDAVRHRGQSVGVADACLQSESLGKWRQVVSV